MNTKARKVMIIGAGNVGASAAYALLNQNICEELILVDLKTSRAEAHAQDLSDAAAYMSISRLSPFPAARSSRVKPGWTN